MKKWISIFFCLAGLYFLLGSFQSMTTKENSVNIESQEKTKRHSKIEKQKKRVIEESSRRKVAALEKSGPEPLLKLKNSKLSIKGSINKSQHREPWWKEYFFEEEISLNGKDYILAPELMAVKNEKDIFGDIIFRVGGFKVIKWDQSQLDIGQQQVVRVLLNKSTMRLNLLTGKIFLTSNSELDTHFLKSEYNFELVQRLPHLGITEVKYSGDEAIFDIEQALLADKKFEKVEIEIIEGSVREK